MLKINKLLKPNSIQEALQLLKNNPNARLLGGGAFLRLSTDLTIHTAIDLYHLNLNHIQESASAFSIGAMVTLRDLETNLELNELLSQSVDHILGVQLRNIATIGGTIYPKYGFSDLITSLLVLNTKLVFEGREAISLEGYLLESRSEKSILKGIIISKEDIKTAFKMIRNAALDYAILNVAVSVSGNQFKIAVGAKPTVAALAYKAMAYLEQEGLNEASIQEAARIACEELRFGTNRLASADYRKDMCSVLIKRALTEVMSC